MVVWVLRRLTFFLIAVFAVGCVVPETGPPSGQGAQPAASSLLDESGDVYPTPALASSTRERREVAIAADGATLAGELDLPLSESPSPLVFIIHHSGPVTRDAYGYMAELLTKAGYAVFRFDKRGVGRSSGEFGCCEREDALAAYQEAVRQEGIDRGQVFIVAQSIGAEHLAESFDAFSATLAPRGVVLLSSLLEPARVARIAAPLHIIVSDSEARLDEIGAQAAAAHEAAQPYGASYYVAERTEHTLFDVSDGPINWRDPSWVTRYHRGAMTSMIDWLDSNRSD